jgi:hypothetical protein
MGVNECTQESAVSTSGVSKVKVAVQAGSDGMTTEQRNVSQRLNEDNKPGSIKHLYVISAYSGQVIVYSTVRGKVTSGGKSLSPTTVTDGGSFKVDFRDGYNRYTREVLEDDGTYGQSMPYLYWWDTKGIYHQHYVTGGQILHISSEPFAVKGIIINMEMTQKSVEK